jgi:hypothetical protein
MLLSDPFRQGANTLSAGAQSAKRLFTWGPHETSSLDWRYVWAVVVVSLCVVAYLWWRTYKCGRVPESVERVAELLTKAYESEDVSSGDELFDQLAAESSPTDQDQTVINLDARGRERERGRLRALQRYRNWRTKKASAVVNAAQAAWAEYGSRERTRANEMMAERFVLRWMKEAGMRPSHIRQFVPAAVTLFFFRTADDVEAKQIEGSMKFRVAEREFTRNWRPHAWRGLCDRLLDPLGTRSISE